MPRVKLAAPKRDKLAELICGAMATQGKGTADAAKVIGCCYNTAKSRIDNPRTLTIDELLKITNWLWIPIEEVRSAIS